MRQTVGVLSVRLAGLLFTGTLAGQSLFPPADAARHGFDPDALDDVTATIERWVDEDRVVGAELLVVKDRHTVYHEAFGFRDRESGARMERDTIGRIRSMTKPFVGTAVLMLAEREELSLDDPVAKHLPSFEHDAARAITIRQLLVHEGGFEQPGYPAALGSYSSLRAAVDAVGAAGPVHAPGTRFVYSDAGSATLGAIVAAVSRMPVETFIQERILTPLGLDSTFCTLTEDDPRRERLSSTYVLEDGAFTRYWDRTRPQEMPFFRASGGMYSTPMDYARFLSLFLDRGRVADMQVLAGSWVELALRATPLSLADDHHRAYGHHWEVGRRPAPEGRLPVFGHTGSDGTFAMAYPDLDLIVCYFTQSRRGTTLREIETLVLGALDPEARALDGRMLFAPPLDDAARSDREQRWRDAEHAHEQDPTDLDALIWYGRRTAYLGRYREAIAIYSRGLELHGVEPRLLRHRGHRHLSRRDFEAAIADFERAADLITGEPDRVEPDGLPNARNTPTSTLQSNIWYHLGLARYVTGDLAGAAKAYEECLKVSANPDMLCATTHWYYMTLRRLGEDERAAALLEPIHAEMDVIENHGYHRLLLMYRGELDPDDLTPKDGDDIQNATVAYGLANWHFYHGRVEAARELWRKILHNRQWSAFGYIAAEAELHRR